MSPYNIYILNMEEISYYIYLSIFLDNLIIEYNILDNLLIIICNVNMFMYYNSKIF